MSFETNVEKAAKENNYFRKVLYTGKHSQLVLMSLAPGEDIGEEKHDDVDQILFFVEGKGEAIIDGTATPVGPGDVSFVPAGATHNFRNSGIDSLKLYTVYSPAEHPDGTAHATKAEAEAREY
jgi:mannose-6-phosphate isomerase-like protein (cupin superfamily)